MDAAEGGRRYHCAAFAHGTEWWLRLGTRAKPTPGRARRAGLRAGDGVEYYSRSRGAWVPAVVRAVGRAGADLDLRDEAPRTSIRPRRGALLSEASAAAAAAAGRGALRWRFRVTGGGNWQCGVVSADDTVPRARARPPSPPRPPPPSPPRTERCPPPPYRSRASHHPAPTSQRTP